MEKPKKSKDDAIEVLQRLADRAMSPEIQEGLAADHARKVAAADAAAERRKAVRASIRAASARDGAARRAATKAGLKVTKSRGGRDTPDNLGGFQLVDRNIVVEGEHYDLSADDVIRLCAPKR
jgi:hypothetical protein